MFAYTVACEFDDARLAQRWIDWLTDGHLSEVCDAGAVNSKVVRFDAPEQSPVVRCEVRYLFQSRSDFERYEREHAPRLRAEGLKRFPAELGLRYTRSTGEIVASLCA